MAKDRKKLQHIHSSVPDKQPTPSTLEVGEIAVNNSKDQEFLSIKNSEDKVVRFSSDEQIVTIMEKKEVMPYKGYVRGETGPSSTSAETPTADSYGSYGITENDLLTNKSNIIVKLNQVAAGNTVKHDKVNGAKDAYNKLVNPTTDSGLTDGAGFFIDMSRYAMQDANPQFSSTTNTCRTTMSGTTIIRGLDGDCGSLLDIKVNSAKTDIETANTEITSATTVIGTNSTTISGNTTLVVSGTTTETKKGNVTETNLANKVENTSGNSTVNVNGNYSGNTTGTTTETKIGNVVENHSGTTTENKKGNVIENNQANKTENTTGNTVINHTGTTNFNYTGATTLSGSSLSSTTTGDTNFNVSGNTVVNTSGGTTFMTSGNTVIHSEGAVGITAKEGILAESSESDIIITANQNICETAGDEATFYGIEKTNIGINCSEDASATTTNIYGGTIVEVAGSADTTISTATTVIGTANTSANTATLSGSNLTVTENNTTITSCNKFEVNSNNISFKQCSGTGGQIEFEYCGGFSAKTDDFEVYECTAGAGQANIKETTTSVSGQTLTLNELTSISAKTPTTYVSGTTLQVKETNINASANTTTLSGNTLTINEASSISAKTPTTYLSGTTLEVKETNVNVSANTTTYSGGSLTETMTGNETYNIGGNLTEAITGNTNVTISGNTTITTEDGTTINTTSGDTNVNTTGNTCIHSTLDANFGGDANTRIGANCSGNATSDNTYIFAETAVTINAPTTNITGDTNISGDTVIGGDTYLSGDTYFKSACTSITSNELGTAICEAFDRSVVTMTREDSPSDTRLSAVYKIFQNGNQIGYDINVPKDGFLKEVTLEEINGIFYLRFVWWIYDADTATYRTGSTDVNIEDLVKDIDENNTDTGRGVDVDVWYNETDKKMNVSATTTVQIVTDGNGTKTFSKNNAVNSLNSYKLNFTHNGFTDEFDPLNASETWTMPHSSLTWTYGATSGKSGSDSFDTSADKSINIPTDISHLNRGKLTISHCNTSETFDPSTDKTISFSHESLSYSHNGFSGTYDPCSGGTFSSPHSSLTATYEATSGKSGSVTFDTSADTNISIPTCVNHLDRHSITFQSGSTASFNSQTYDPGKDCANSAETINIPTSITHLSEWDGSCLNIDGCAKATNFYQTSDMNYKEDIGRANFDKVFRASQVPIKQFKFKDDPNHVFVYGVIAQDVEHYGLDEIVLTDEFGKKSVDYTSLTMLKIASLENENKQLKLKLSELIDRIEKLENN